MSYREVKSYPQLKRVFVNVYEDEEGRFISDGEYSSYQSAFENRDDLSTYRETVEIVRHVSNEKE